MRRKGHEIVTAALLLGTLALGGATLLLRTPDEVSAAERRELAGKPLLSLERLVSGRYFSDLEAYVQDQFPLLDGLRGLAAASRLYLFRQGDSNGLTPWENAVYKPDAALDEGQIRHAANLIGTLASTFPAGVNSYVAVIPDKADYVAAQLRRPLADYERLCEILRETLGGAVGEIPLRDCLDEQDYYRTDTHWRQERLGRVVDRLAESMGLPLRFSDTAYEESGVSPFYGVLYGQLALPLPSERLTYLRSGALEDARVYYHDEDAYGAVYRLDKREGMDPYDLFLGGATTCVTIENENAATDRRLILFRDSFGSSLAPLLVAQYRQIVLIDLRYAASAYLERYVTPEPGDDVLFLYSAMILNRGRTLR